MPPVPGHQPTRHLGFCRQAATHGGPRLPGACRVVKPPAPG
jgi:hypothetical protein